MHEIQWGSIGCGDVMEVKSGPALQLVNHSQLLAVMRRNTSLAMDFAARHNVPNWYGQADQLINNPAINAIYIATPPNTHLEYTRLAAQAGKVVYVEKPMANSYAQCLEMIEVCKEYEVPLFVAYYRRALPRFLKVKDILNSGQLGIIKEVRVKLLHTAKHIDISGESNWRVQSEIAGCGYFCDLGSHIFDLLQFLLGDIPIAVGRVSNSGGFYQAEDIVEADFSFKSGVRGSGVWNFNADQNFDRTEIIGSDGKVSYAHFAESDVTLNNGAGEVHFEIPHPVHIQQPLIQLMIDELRGEGSCPSTGASGAETNRIMDQILGRR
ncbi:MAG: Gfo/Idh/MocA family oxidoreductase [Candidatus Marinimicrobia bacterium]|nr:Gfo/Idh/MocA family oxidoreductase [Candidatus Neomarinimicrobiota bacterium]